jgi:hypothetical protein
VTTNLAAALELAAREWASAALLHGMRACAVGLLLTRDVCVRRYAFDAGAVEC